MLRNLPPLPDGLSLLRLHKLSPEQARTCLAIKHFVETQLMVPLPGKKIVVALSGGPDSLSLLLILYILSHSQHYTLYAAHLNHNLRQEAKAEAMWCQQLCQELQIPYYTASVNVPEHMQQQKTGLEETARNCRYTFYQDALHHFDADFIAIGHHLHDLAEDVLMRLLRGAGWPALSGMPGVCFQRCILRPLLHTGQTDIATFLHTLGIRALTDASNTSMDFLRNRVRHTIVPLFLQENPAFLQRIRDLWQLGAIDKEYFSSTLQSLCGAIETAKQNSSSLPSHAPLCTELYPFRQMHKALRLRAYKHIIQEIGGRPDAQKLIALDRICMGKQFPKSIQFHGLVAVVSKKYILWETPEIR